MEESSKPQKVSILEEETKPKKVNVDPEFHYFLKTEALKRKISMKSLIEVAVVFFVENNVIKI